MPRNERLQILLKSFRLSIREFAKRLGVPQHVPTTWVYRGTVPQDADLARRAADLLNTDTIDLFGRSYWSGWKPEPDFGWPRLKDPIWFELTGFFREEEEDGEV